MKTEAKKLLSSEEAVNLDPSERSKRKKKRKQKSKLDDDGMIQRPTKLEQENESQMDDDITKRHSDPQQIKRKKHKDDSDQTDQQIKKKIKRKPDKSKDVESKTRGKDVELPQKEEMRTAGDGGSESVEQEELSPEEVRKMERKLKKMRKKEAKKSAPPKEPDETEEEKKESVVHLGSVYLQTWKSDRPNWVFRKVRQVWLLRNMYTMDKVSDEDFPILLEYLAGLQGKGRETTVAEAEKLLQGQEHEGEGEGTGETLSAVQLERVRQVLQVLV
ncbi:uncharacterized protein C7orf50 homolog [Branchiostoma floridae]|uniref:Uncharacterized protein C7orf50 homolog n=1 Tax=Branchiostoma floridae TaxID=7739 RepID=A0A9J7N9X6_BRAFL|nr:uncharacterized protein C7orf50 homolog [Branchiostoma floridae]